MINIEKNDLKKFREFKLVSALIIRYGSDAIPEGLFKRLETSPSQLVSILGPLFNIHKLKEILKF